jgi:hypothetical protein
VRRNFGDRVARRWVLLGVGGRGGALLGVVLGQRLGRRRLRERRSGQGGEES